MQITLILAYHIQLSSTFTIKHFSRKLILNQKVFKFISGMVSVEKKLVKMIDNILYLSN